MSASPHLVFRVPGVFVLLWVEHRNENCGHCSLGGLFGGSPVLVVPVFLGEAWAAGWEEGAEGGISLMPSLVLASLRQPTPALHQWQGSNVCFLEVRHPSLKFFLMAFS